MFAVGAGLYIWQVLSSQTRPQPDTFQQPGQTKPAEPVQEPGFALYYDESLAFGFLFPKQEDPLKNNPEIDMALRSFRSKNFLFRLYERAGFTYQPFLKSQTVCRYDGALHAYSGCQFATIDVGESVKALEASFREGDTVRHTLHLKADYGKYLLEIATDYTFDCPESRNSVCETRSQLKKQELRDFVHSVVAKNPAVFQE